MQSTPRCTLGAVTCVTCCHDYAPTLTVCATPVMTDITLCRADGLGRETRHRRMSERCRRVRWTTPRDW
jgi:hypothetical protein